MGTGKTRCALALSVNLRLNVFVVCPLTVSQSWDGEAEETGMSIYDLYNYDELAGKPGLQPHHGYLARRDVPNPKSGKHTVFTATDKWLALVKQRVLLIVDEAQNCKNDSDKSKAVRELAKHVYAQVSLTRSPTDGEWSVNPGSGPSRVLLLSGTLFDKKQHAKQLMDLLGIMCILHGRESAADEYEQVYEMFTDTQRQICRSMPRLELPVDLDIACGFYDMGAEDSEQLQVAMTGLLAKVSNKRPKMKDIQHALTSAQGAKVAMVVRRARVWLGKSGQDAARHLSHVPDTHGPDL